MIVFEPTEVELAEAKKFLIDTGPEGLSLPEVLCHFAYRHVKNAFHESHNMIGRLESSEACTGGNIPVFDLFENEVIRHLRESK